MFKFFTIALTLLFSAQSTFWATAVDAGLDPAWEDLAFCIEDSRCFVGLAPIYLSVSKLKPKDGNLIGTYKIEVPLMTSKNDHGKIVLPLNVSVSELGAEGGVLKGKAHSKTEDGMINDIVCEILPKKDQTIKLAITTKHRTVNFVSRYTVIDISEAKSDV